MRKIFNLMVAVMLAAIAAGCSVRDLADIEPTGWEKQQFEREVRQSVAKAVNTPGIDNGSTIVVTNAGDTLIAPSDTTLKASSIRTVYVDIQSPAYPNKISSRALEISSVIMVIILVAGSILLILIGVFVVIFRRQHGRNKSINHAISEGYQLPESFYTGVPSSPSITINQISEVKPRTADNTNAPTDNNGEPSTTPPPHYATASPNLSSTIRDAAKSINNVSNPTSYQTLRNGLLLVGFGVLIFIFFASMGSIPPGFLCGGTLVILGAAKLFTYFYCRKG